MANVIISPQSGILEFNTGTAGTSFVDSSLSGASRLTFNSGEINLKSYATGVLDRFSVDGAQGRLFSVNDSVTGTIFSVNDAAGLPVIEVNSTTSDIVNIGTYGTNALVVSGNAVGIGAFPSGSNKLTVAGGVAIDSGTITTSQPLSLTQTWNAGGVTFKGIDVNVTDTASNAASLLMDLRVGGASKFNISKNGNITTLVEGSFASPAITLGLYKGFYCGNNSIYVKHGNNVGACFFHVASFGLRQDSLLAWSSGSDSGTGHDLILVRDSANTLAQRNGANAQESRVYGTYTSATNFERLNMKYNGTALAYQIGTEKGSGGGIARPLEFQTDGTTRMTIGATGNVGIGTASPNYALQVNSSATSRFAVQSNGRAHIGEIANSNFQYSVFNISADEPALNYGATINLEDTRLVAEGIGSRVLMGSRYNATEFTGGVVFGAYKENGIIGNYGYSFTIGTRAHGSSITEKMRITGAGNVGIGTTTPASRLTVTGGDAEVTDIASGVILKSPDGTRYRITVANGGTLTVTAV